MRLSLAPDDTASVSERREKNANNLSRVTQCWYGKKSNERQEKKSERETKYSWLDPKQTKPTKLKVDEAKNELTHNITFDNRNKIFLSLSFTLAQRRTK